MFPHQFPNNKDIPLAGHASTAGLQSSPFAASSQAICTNPLCSQVLLSHESAVSAPPPGGLGRKLPAEPVRGLMNMTLKPQHRARSPHCRDPLWDPEPHLRSCALISMVQRLLVSLSVLQLWFGAQVPAFGTPSPGAPETIIFSSRAAKNYFLIRPWGVLFSEDLTPCVNSQLQGESNGLPCLNKGETLRSPKALCRAGGT